MNNNLLVTKRNGEKEPIDLEKIIKPSELMAMTDHAGLLPRDMTGLHMDPISQGFYLSANNVDVNYLLYTVAQN